MAGHHARLAPSDADRWVECPGSIQLSEGILPEPDTEETLEGNAADWVAKQYAAGNEVAYGTPVPTPGNYSVDYDMIHGAKMWRDALGYGAVYGVPAVSDRIHPTDNWGEPDGYVWEPIARRLRLPDYKYGFGIHEAFEHWQTLNYAALIIDMLGVASDPDVEVWLGIVQPRAFHADGPVRWWKTDVGSLRAYWNILHGAAVLALPYEGTGMVGKVPPTKTGPYCLHCPARGVCKTLQAGVTQVAEYVGTSQRVAMDAAAIGVELGIMEAVAKLLDGRVTALQAQAEALIRKGQRVPGYCMEPASTKLSWLKDVTVAEVAALGAVIGKDLRKPPTPYWSLVTPTQAINAGVDEAVINQYASRPPGALKLARDTLNKARKAFGANDT